MKNSVKNNQSGSMMVLSLVIAGIFLAITIGAISVSMLEMKLNTQMVARAQALQIAEAGANYYRWVLYHDPGEFCNNQTCVGQPNYGPYGPFEYKDSAGKNIIGYYELYITPPPLKGSTIVRVKSVGWVAGHAEIKRAVEVECGIPSWSAYSVLCNSDIRFGAGTEIWGRVHSNGGVRFDGVANNLVSSSLSNYDDPDHDGSKEFGVHTHAHAVGDYDPKELSSSGNLQNYADVFKGGRSFPLPIISFDLLDNYASDMLVKANLNGKVLKSSGQKGYHITLKTNNTMDIKIVTRDSGSCDGVAKEGIDSEENYSLGTSTPANGLLFVKDKVWIDGKVNDGRITVLAFREPLTGNNTDIIINNDLTYSSYDGRDAIGLIAQGNITIGLSSEDNLEINAAMIAKEGRIGRNYYNCHNCGNECHKSAITVRGSMATRNRYGFAFTDDTGYRIRNLIYDNNLTFNPPPHFPTTGEYTFLSWKED
ncbi:MAG: pilus assembly PilX N-terminal domain-containing protein [Patescibacteria group bacterium]|nr:pilus assembly PilX N-terminal domain-containing protein [Patescibacteria group bacterium]MDD4610842.1 pilus assembly PilX N-terminal domain-containing protein [Patescibacteria group bacterium]